MREPHDSTPESRPARETPADHRYKNTEVRGGCTEKNAWAGALAVSQEEMSSFVFIVGYFIGISQEG